MKVYRVGALLPSLRSVNSLTRKEADPNLDPPNDLFGGPVKRSVQEQNVNDAVLVLLRYYLPLSGGR